MNPGKTITHFNKTPITYANIPRRILPVNKTLLVFGDLTVIGSMSAAPNQPADRLIKISESPCIQTDIYLVYHTNSGFAFR